jgi:hypothetical protein
VIVAVAGLALMAGTRGPAGHHQLADVAHGHPRGSCAATLAALPRPAGAAAPLEPGIYRTRERSIALVC